MACLLATLIAVSSIATADEEEPPVQPPVYDPGYLAPGALDDGEGATVTETQEAIERVDTYEESVLYGSETPPGLFLRLAEDWLFTSEIGTRGIGHIPMWPRGAVKLGPFLVFPYLTASISWSSSAYFAEESDYGRPEADEEDASFYTTVGGGFTGQYLVLGGRGNVTFGLDYRHHFYSNGEGGDDEVVGGLGFSYTLVPGVWVAAGIKAEYLVEPLRLEDQHEQRRFQVYPYLDLGFNDVLSTRFNVEFGIDYVNAAYDGNQYEARDLGEWDAHIKVSYPFYRETTRIYLRYDYLWSDNRSEDGGELGSGHQLSGGLEGTIPIGRSGRLEGFVEGGYRRDVYNEATFDEIPEDDDDQEGTIVLAAGLRYFAGARTTFELHLLRTFEHSSRGNYQITDRADLWVTRVISHDLLGRVGAYVERADPSQDDEVAGSMVWRWGVGVGLRYMADDWVDIFLDVDYDSTFDDDDYYDDSEFRVTLGVDLYFW